MAGLRRARRATGGAGRKPACNTPKTRCNKVISVYARAPEPGPVLTTELLRRRDDPVGRVHRSAVILREVEPDAGTVVRTELRPRCHHNVRLLAQDPHELRHGN